MPTFPSRVANKLLNCNRVICHCLSRYLEWLSKSSNVTLSSSFCGNMKVFLVKLFLCFLQDVAIKVFVGNDQLEETLPDYKKEVKIKMEIYQFIAGTLNLVFT